jgi:hypothetical protein
MAYTNVTHAPKETKDKAVLVDMVALAGIEGYGFTSPSDRTFLTCFGIGAAMLTVDLVTVLVVHD